MSEVDERSYREMVSGQDAAQVDTWAADLFIDFAKRLGVGNAIASFCQVTGLDARAFQRAFLVGGGPDHVVGIDTAGVAGRADLRAAEGHRRAAADRPEGPGQARRLPRDEPRGDELYRLTSAR